LRVWELPHWEDGSRAPELEGATSTIAGRCLDYDATCEVKDM
jgi:hypothetical protein